MINVLKTHALGVVIAVAVLFVGHAWITEHDNRIIAEQTVKTAQVQIDSLQKQEATAEQAGQAAIVALQKQAAAIKTPAQAIQAIPTVTDVPLNVRTAPGLPDAVTVDALPLYKELEQGKQDAVALNTCNTALASEKGISADKDKQIKALKKKKGFFARLKKEAVDTAVTVGIGLVLGYVAHK